MKHKFVVALIAIMAVLLILCFIDRIPNSSLKKPPYFFPVAPLPTSTNETLSLITEPDDGMAPVIAAIGRASSSIDLAVYELSAKPVEQALLAAAQRGVAVRVILDRGYQDKPSIENVGAYNFLHSNNITVHWSSSAFTFTHEKAMIIDDDESLIMSFNLTVAAFTGDRDFGIFDRAPEDVAAIEATFLSDWGGSDAKGASGASETGADLVWSPGSRSELIALIDSAKTSLDIYNEEMDDADIEAALEAASRRGVKVAVVMTYQSAWKAAFAELIAAGVMIRTYTASAKPYIHAKAIIADNTRAFVGSENFSITSLEYNRELGIIFLNPTMIASLNRTFAKDWAGAKEER